MTYRRFNLASSAASPATIATAATFRSETRPTVATVASVTRDEGRTFGLGLRQWLQGSYNAKAKAVALQIRPDSEAEFEERRAMARGAVPDVYVDAWALLQLQRPCTVPQNRWRRAIDDTGLFLDQFGGYAAEFGWTSADLFGVPTQGRRGGLIWWLEGEAVRALGPEHAVTRTGRIFDRLA